MTAGRFLLGGYLILFCFWEASVNFLVRWESISLASPEFGKKRRSHGMETDRMGNGKGNTSQSRASFARKDSASIRLLTFLCSPFLVCRLLSFVWDFLFFFSLSLSVLANLTIACMQSGTTSHTKLPDGGRKKSKAPFRIVREKERIVHITLRQLCIFFWSCAIVSFISLSALMGSSHDGRSGWYS